MTSTDPLTSRGGVDLFRWDPARTDNSRALGPRRGNFGDLLGPLLVEKMVPHPVGSPDEGPRHTLLSVGSVLHFAPVRATVWGSGVNFKISPCLPAGVRSLDIRAVRGPLTARTLLDSGVEAPAVFGDPALLLPRYMPELRDWARGEKKRVLCVPNLNDFDGMRADAEDLGLDVVSPLAPLEDVLRAIATSAFVLGSSLHAVAIADALGIPARYVVSEHEHPFKYRDYLAGSGRPLTLVAQTLREALELGAHEAPDADLDALEAAFPFDLWDGSARRTTASRYSEHAAVLTAWHEIMQTTPPATIFIEREFVQRHLPGLAAAALDDCATTGLPSERFVERFDGLRELRESLLPHLRYSDLKPLHADMLRALDAGVPESALRAAWLDDVGAHAIVNIVRASSRLLLASLAVRPGRLTNDITSMEAVLLSDGGEVCRRDIPLFDRYRTQWMLDLSVAFELPDMGAPDVLTMRIVITDGDGGRTVVDCLARGGDRAVFALTRITSIATLDRWQASASELGISS